MHVLKTLSIIVDGLSECFAMIAGWMFFAVGVFIAYEVFMRYIIISPTIWVDEVSRIFQIWASFAAMAYVLKHRKHIVIDLCFREPYSMPRRIAETFALLLIMLFAGVVAKYGWTLWLKSTLAGHTTDSYLAVPKVLIQSAIWVGFGLLALQALVEIYKIWRGAQIKPSRRAGGAGE